MKAKCNWQESTCVVIVLFVTSFWITVQAASSTSTSYSSITETNDAAGGHRASASYSSEESAGTIGGVSSVAVPAIVGKNGFIGQLDEVAPPEIEAWRQTHFGSIENSGDGADLNDYDHDGLVNLTEFAFGFNPKVSGDGQLPVGQIIGGNFVVYFNQPPSVSGITYGAEWSTALLPATWTVIPDTGIPPQHAFSVPIDSNKRMFMRFRISNP